MRRWGVGSGSEARSSLANRSTLLQRPLDLLNPDLALTSWGLRTTSLASLSLTS